MKKLLDELIQSLVTLLLAAVLALLLISHIQLVVVPAREVWIVDGWTITREYVGPQYELKWR